MPDPKKCEEKLSDNRRFLRDLARAYGGAIVFSFPMLMTMEMWWLGFSMSGVRLTLFALLTVPLLIGLSYYDGFEDTFTGTDDIRETFVSYFVGFTASAIMLLLFGVITSGMSADEIIGKISIQAVAASLGAMFAQSLVGGDRQTEDKAEQRKRNTSYLGQLFLTGVGAIFLSMSVSPTEEMALIAYQMTNWHAVALAALTLVVMHAFFYVIEMRRPERDLSPETSHLSLFCRYTAVGYALVLVISCYILWTFGTLQGLSFGEQLKIAFVLSFPAALGGSASRIIL